MNLSWFNNYEGEVKTLQLTRDPLYYGLGYYKDVNGVTWDVHCVFGGCSSPSGKPYVCARPVCDIPYYSTATGSHSYGIHKWLPYYFEIVKEEVEVN